MKQNFAWYRVKDITNLSEVSCVLAKESYHDNSTMADDVDFGRQQWYILSHILASHDLILMYRLATFPTEHNYHKKRITMSKKVGVSLESCDTLSLPLLELM